MATYDFAFQDEAVRAAYRFAPGQFNMLYLPGAGEIAISVSDDPQSAKPALIRVRVVGNVTRTLAAMQVGETLGLRGPFGTCWPLAELRRPGRPAGGRRHRLGTAATADLRAVTRPPAVRASAFALRSSLADTLLYTREYEDWSRRGLVVHTTVDRVAAGWMGHVGVVTLCCWSDCALSTRNTRRCSAAVRK